MNEQDKNIIHWHTDGISIISCDVFDTLLQRNGLCEQSRVALIARHAAKLLSDDCAIVIAPAVLSQARGDVQHYAYRGLDMIDPGGEVQFAQMIEGMAAVLGLSPQAAQILRRAEIEFEKTQLSPNTRLLAWLHQRARQGFRIIAISDTWHEAATIRDLLDSVAPAHPIGAIYTSADLNATKRSAQIFPLVAAREAVAASKFLHIGDDHLADVCMAERAGLRVRKIDPPRLTLLRRKLDGARFRALRSLPPV